MKNFSSLIRKKVIYLSIVLVVVALTNIVLSYSFYLGKVVGNESSTTLSFLSAGIQIQYDNNSDSISESNIMSGWAATKSFSLSSNISENDFTNNQTKLWYEIFLNVDSNTFPSDVITYTLKPSESILGDGATALQKSNVGISTGVNQDGISLGVGYFTVGSNKHDYTIEFNYMNSNFEYGNFPDNTFSVHISAKVVVNSTLIIDLNGGSIEGDTVRFTSKNGKIEIEKPARHGYVFSGWEIVEGTGVVDGSEITVNSDILKIKANWEKRDNNVLLFLDLDGGNTTDERYNIVPIKSTTELSVPTKENYEFNGWRLITDNNAVISNNNITVDDTDVIIQAQWVFSKVNLLIDLDGGTTTQDVLSRVVMNSTVTLIEPTKTGYTFDSWEITAGTAALNGNLITMSNVDVTVRAKWRINSYTVSFDSNGGSSVASQTVNYGGTATKPTNPTKTGYLFQGWTLNGSTFNFSTKITSNIILTANWKTVIPTFTYLRSDGSAASYLLIEDGGNNWRIKLLETGTLTFSWLGNAQSGIDAFLVGGGGGGANAYDGYDKTYYGCGGGGGYTATYKAISLSLGTSYSILIGSGGAGANGTATGGTGGTTSCFGYSVAGGAGGKHHEGGNGGSGGGYGGSSGASGGGSDGSNGVFYKSDSNIVGTGQGTTTREFGEAGADLYAGGGGGGGDLNNNGYGGDGGGGDGHRAGNVWYAKNGVANTGGGGGGGRSADGAGSTGASGGSGIVVIRNKR